MFGVGGGVGVVEIVEITIAVAEVEVAVEVSPSVKPFGVFACLFEGSMKAVGTFRGFPCILPGVPRLRDGVRRNFPKKNAPISLIGHHQFRTKM